MFERNCARQFLGHTFKIVIRFFPLKSKEKWRRIRMKIEVQLQSFSMNESLTISFSLKMKSSPQRSSFSLVANVCNLHQIGKLREIGTKSENQIIFQNCHFVPYKVIKQYYQNTCLNFLDLAI